MNPRWPSVDPSTLVLQENLGLNHQRNEIEPSHPPVRTFQRWAHACSDTLSCISPHRGPRGCCKLFKALLRQWHSIEGKKITSILYLQYIMIFVVSSHMSIGEPRKKSKGSTERHFIQGVSECETDPQCTGYNNHFRLPIGYLWILLHLHPSKYHHHRVQ